MNRHVFGFAEVINIIFKIWLLNLAVFVGRPGSIKMKDK